MDGWQIVITAEKFEMLRDDRRFRLLLTLGRIINALRFCHMAVVNENSPFRGNRINSFLFMSAVLYEGIKVARNLGRYFRELDSFKTGIGALLRDKDTQDLWDTSLNRLRNKLVFHFDGGAAQDALQDIILPSYRFAASDGPKGNQSYYVLADEVFMHFLVKQHGSLGNQLTDQATDLIRRTTDLGIRFIDASQRLIAEALRVLECTSQE